MSTPPNGHMTPAALSQVGKAGERGPEVWASWWVLVLNRLGRKLPISGFHFRDQESHPFWNAFPPFQVHQSGPFSVLPHILRNSRACPTGVLLHQTNWKHYAVLFPCAIIPYQTAIYLWSLPSFQPSLQSLHGWGIPTSIQNQFFSQLYQTPVPLIITSLFSFSLGSFPSTY